VRRTLTESHLLITHSEENLQKICSRSALNVPSIKSVYSSDKLVLQISSQSGRLAVQLSADIQQCPALTQQYELPTGNIAI